MKVALAAVAALSVALLGCKKESGAPTTPAAAPASDPAPDPTPAAVTLSDAELEALMRGLIGFLEKMAIAIEGTGKDCPSMAAAIDRVTADHADLFERTRKLDDPAIEDRADAWMQANGTVVTELGARVSAAAQPCMEDASVQAAMERVGS